MKIIALVIFLATYLSLLIFPKIRSYIAMLSAGIFVILKIVPLNSVFEYIDLNVILMIAGTMGIVSLFIESKMPDRLADMLIAKMPNVKWLIIALSLFAGIISAFVDNVATLLMVAPVAINISKKLGISPVSGVIAIAVSSNLQGAATLVGDTTSILLGGYAHMNFLDFFVYLGKPGLFWIVQLGALASVVVLMILFRKEKQPIEKQGIQEVKDYFPTGLLVAMIVLLISASFIPNKPQATNGIICMTLFLIGTARLDAKEKHFHALKRHALEIDFYTILLLAGLFVVVGGITEAGIIEDISKLFVSVSKDNIFVIYSLIVWASVLFSAFIDNIPYVATMLPVTRGIASILAIDPTLLYFGLLVGATLGGNLTPIGASANVTALGMLRKEGYEVSTGEFMRIGVPFTLVAVLSGYILVWVLYGMG